MKTWRVFVALIILGAVVEFLTPVLSAKTGVILPLIQKNCGAVPVFIQDIMRVQSEPNPSYWQGSITCGIGFIAFLLFPGFLKIVKWLYSFVNPKTETGETG